MTTSPGEHRPPTILSEYGEGYCRVCRFIEGLDVNGRFLAHDRGPQSGWNANVRTQCKGTGAKPPKVTPYASRLAAFKTVAPHTTCPVCNREISLLSDGRFTQHVMSAYTNNLCNNGYKFPPAGRDHGSERGV